MSKNQKRTYLLYLLTAPIVAAAAIVLRSVALFTEYDAALGYFHGPALPIAMAALLVTVIVALAVLTHELRGFFVTATDYRDLPTLFSGLFLGIALVFFSVVLTVAAIGQLSSPTVSPLAIIAAFLTAVAALVGAALFAVHAFDGSTEGALRAMLTLAVAVACLLYALYLYLTPEIRINEPNKALSIATWIAASFFFLGETRAALLRAKWALHTYVTTVTVMLAATLCLPNLVYHAVYGAPLLGNTLHDFVILGVLLYALSRLVAAYLSAVRSATPEGQYITDFTAEVAAEIAKVTAEVAKDTEDTEEPDEEATDR
ncbi:MAG: hypothetical protein IKC73_02660 [Clostridia bacterium]|nr:hypothetical protein [Clostridia bacterium]